MNLHPDVWLDLAHQHHDDLVGQARIARLAADAHARGRERARRRSGRTAGAGRRAPTVA